MNRTNRSGWALVHGLLSAAPVDAQAPLGTAFTYQGQLRSAGEPADGPHDLRFRLYDALVGGAQVGPTLCQDNVGVTEGLFTVLLNIGAEFAGQERFLEIDVRADTGLDCGSPAGFVTLAPRQPLTAAPNALFALNADLRDGLDSSAFLQAVPNPLTLSGDEPAGAIIQGTNSSGIDGSSGVYGLATAGMGAIRGVWGQTNSSSAGATGVYGLATATSTLGQTVGVFGESAGNVGTGVRGAATSGTGTTIGGHFISASTAGTAVVGVATAFSGTADGGRFMTGSPGGRAVCGQAISSSGAAYGGYFECFSPSGFGGYFRNNVLGIEFDVELAGPSGAVNTRGFVYREYTGGTASAAIPIGYGRADAAGAILSGTGNFTVAHPAASQYDVTVTGENSSNAGFTVPIPPVSNSPRIANVADSGATFRVNMWNLSGTAVDNASAFTIWRSDPN